MCEAGHDRTALVNLVRSVLDDSLLKPHWRAMPNRKPTAGHCYAASEALYHMLGGKAAGWTPVVLQHEGGSHWFLRDRTGAPVDATGDQFSTAVPHALGRGTGFLTRQPSARAAEIMRRVHQAASR